MVKPMADLRPTSTSYAVLGLLAVRPWTTYELARQSERSLRWFFPRAERAVYLEAKRLVALGWADAEKTATGKRASTVYRINRAGRKALRAWLAEPSAPTQVESEAALKVFFGDQTGLAELRASIDLIGEQATESLRQLGAMAGGEQPFPERMHTNVLSMRLICDVHQAIQDWSHWAADAVQVLESDDGDAIARQTEQALREITSRG
jgi:DNA-binding PadR family transcriptional regulator